MTGRLLLCRVVDVAIDPVPEIRESIPDAPLRECDPRWGVSGPPTTLKESRCEAKIFGGFLRRQKDVVHVLVPWL